MSNLSNSTKNLMVLKARLLELKKHSLLTIPPLKNRVLFLLKKVEKMLKEQLEDEKAERAAAVITQNNMAAQKSQKIEEERRRAEEAQKELEDELAEIEELLKLLEEQNKLVKEISVVKSEMVRTNSATPEAAISVAAKQQQNTDLPTAKPDGMKQERTSALSDRLQRLEQQHGAAVKSFDQIFACLIERTKKYSPAATALFYTAPGQLLLTMMMMNRVNVGENNNDDDKNLLGFHNRPFVKP